MTRPVRATYRLQLHAGFTFGDAEALVPYLSALGVSHLYLSPILKARAGSLHGYDIVDHNAVNPELGGEAGLESLHRALEARDMGILLDVVPNHMGVGGADNAWWLDVLEWGEASPYARFFDIDWHPSRPEMEGKLLLPFLGDHYGAVLERGELVPRFDRSDGSISVWYWEHRLPLAVRDYADLVRPALVPEFAGLFQEFRGLGWGASARRRAVGLKARLAEVAAERPEIGDAIDRELALLAQPGSLARLHRLLEGQNWRVSYWRVAADEINYRRFFDINDLAALRMVEEPELFDRAHRLIFDLVARGIVDGLRIDHVDGLFNPAEYCRLLQARAAALLGRPIYLAVEKILAPHEPIRRDWPVAGTTGYDFMNEACGLFVDREGEAGMDAAWRGFTGLDMAFAAEVVEAKRHIIDQHMASELRVLALRLGRLAASHWRSRDFTLSTLYQALKEVVACLPVYRTYVTSRRVTDNDRRYIDWALAQARKNASLDADALDFIKAVLDTSAAGLYSRRQVIDFTMRLQQYTGPVMAKGYEDTALYRFNRLMALNEVGGDPTRFGLSPTGFHRACRARGRRHPQALLATATHDAKRGEDVRLRIGVLAELPEEWRARLDRWSRFNASYRRELDGGPAPEPNDEYLIYQTLLGAWPGEAEREDFAERLAAAAVKSAKEAKRRTSWAHPDPAYEEAVAAFVRAILASRPFLDDFAAFHRRVEGIGMVYGLAQTLLKLTVPGIPDFYQGTELWGMSLVDPDNRRPVDFALRQALLGRLAEGPLPADTALWRDGAVKQEMIRRALDLRRRQPAPFAEGAYRPLAARGNAGAGLLAFARRGEGRTVVVAVPLRLARLWPTGEGAPPLGPAWRGLAVDAPAPRFRDLLSGRVVEAVKRRESLVLRAPDLFAAFPLALLEAEDGSR